MWLPLWIILVDCWFSLQRFFTRSLEPCRRPSHCFPAWRPPPPTTPRVCSAHRYHLRAHFGCGTRIPAHGKLPSPESSWSEESYQSLHTKDVPRTTPFPAQLSFSNYPFSYSDRHGQPGKRAACAHIQPGEKKPVSYSCWQHCAWYFWSPFSVSGEKYLQTSLYGKEKKRPRPVYPGWWLTPISENSFECPLFVAHSAWGRVCPGMAQMTELD